MRSALLTFRKLLREDQLEPVTKAAQQEELERRKRLEQQRKDYAAPIPTVPLELLPGEPGPGRGARPLRKPSEAFSSLDPTVRRIAFKWVKMDKNVLLRLSLLRCSPCVFGT